MVPVSTLALSAADPVTGSAPAPISQQRKALLCSQNGLIENLQCGSPATQYALTSTYAAQVPHVPVLIRQTTSVPSAAPTIITPLRERASERDRIITPYNPLAFERALDAANLTHMYPDLVHNLTYGFPLGDVAPITETYTPPNHFSVDEHHAAINEYFYAERDLKRMSGPFSKSEVEEILGPFRTSPIIVDVTEGKNGGPVKKRICRHLSYKGAMGFSVNDCLDSDDYPTRWGTAEQVADIVSIRFFDYPRTPRVALPRFPCTIFEY
jgi:hypothetical protein